MGFNIGDVVRSVKSIDGVIAEGSIGMVTILDFGESINLNVGVCWEDSFPDGHDLRGKCENGHGWWVNEHSIELVSAARPIEPFVVGDIVMCLIDSPDHNDCIHVGSTGTVCRGNSSRVGVRWDDYVNGHNCEGYCESGYGWYVDDCNLARICEEFETNSDEELLEFLKAGGQGDGA